jgi:hypothetical protein
LLTVKNEGKMERIAGFIIFISLLILGGYFLEKGKLGSASFTTFMGIILICGLAFYGFDRLKVLDIKNLKLILTELKETKEEIFAKQEDLKRTALTMSEILAFSNSAQGRLDSTEGYKIKREWYEHKLNKLIKDFDFDDKEIKKIRKFSEKYKEIDKLFGDRNALKTSDPDYKEVKEKLEQLSEEIKEMQKEDLIENK